jgi:hypothetical protein
MRGLWQNRVRIFLSQMATRVEFSDLKHHPLAAQIVDHIEVKHRPPRRSIQIFAVCLVSVIPGLTRSRINDQLHVIPDSDPGSRLSRDTFGLALPPMYFLFWQKEAKPVSQVKSPGCILRSAGLRTYPLNCWPWAFAKTCGKRQREIPVFRLRRKPA